MESKKSGLATAGLVLGIIGICTSFIPIVNNASFFLGILAIVFGMIPIIKKSSKGKAIASLILGVLAVVITLSLQNSWSKSLDELSNDLDTMTGANTQEVLKKVDVQIGDFKATTDKYGWTETKLTVKITNKSDKQQSFDIEIEAIDVDGNRIGTDYIYADDLASGQSQSFNLFEYVEDDVLDNMKKATFKVIEASMY